jgi:hypothetical protein
MNRFSTAFVLFLVIAGTAGAQQERRPIKGDIEGDGHSNVIVVQVEPHCYTADHFPVPGDVHASWHREWPLVGATASAQGQVFEEGPWQIAATGDFDGNGTPDLFWQRLLDTQMDGGTESIASLNYTLTPLAAPHRYTGPPTADGPAVVPEPGWTLVGSGDFGSVLPANSHEIGPRDRKADLLWRNTATGDLSLWLSDGTAAFPDRYPLAGPGSDVVAVAVADLDNDWQQEIIFQEHAGSELIAGRLSYWKMNGLSHVDGGALIPARTANPGWVIVGAGDFDGDSKDDLLWRNVSTKKLVIWLMDGPARRDGGMITPDATLGAVDDGCQYSLIGGPR